MHNYNNLQIWQDAMDIVEMIYQVTAQFPPEEKYGLRSQMNRSAISIPSNIAEGAGRNTDKEFSHFVSIAIGSMYEFHTQIILCERISYIDHCLSMQLQTKLDNLQRMAACFKKRLEYSSINMSNSEQCERSNNKVV